MDAMSSTISTAAPAVWAPPAAVRLRGTLAVLAGAGEGADVYARFGARIAADGYIVGVFASDEGRAATEWLASAEATPRVLVGSDRGAATALTAVVAAASSSTATAAIDGLVLAGLPVAGADDGSAVDADRTACPVHLGVLGASTRAATAGAPLPIPGADALAGIRVPVLAIHGGADPIAPFAAAQRALSALPILELVETVDGRHDALNDQSHRSVAATLVLWLERLRADGVEAPIVRTVAA